MKKKDKTQKKEEILIDGSNTPLGRLSSKIAISLIGKDKASYQRNIFSGSKVRVTNASKINITPKKMESITHARYSGHPGGLRILSAEETIKRKGYGELVRLSVYQMLPDNKLRREMMKHLIIEE